jgi:prephenate dehydratase
MVAHQEALKKEIERLRQVYHHQNLKKMNSSSHAAAAAAREQSPNHEAIQCSEN